MNGFRAYQLVVAACELRLPDLLAAHPQTADELAVATHTNAAALRRALRGLVAWGVFTEDDEGRFHATSVSDEFRTDHPGLRNMTLMLNDEAYPTWAHLMYTLATGEPAFEHLHGKSRWRSLAEDPQAAAMFNAAMVEGTKRVAAAFAATYDFGAVQTVVDVGGGSGALLAAVLQAHPHMRGVLFDLPAGMASAPAEMKAYGLDDRVTLVQGSFFDSVPAGGDLYLLKSIIHDWDEERAQAILQTCRKVMNESSRLTLIERDFPERVEDPERHLSAMMGDLHMLLLLGGRERTVREYGDLFSHSGLRLKRSLPIDGEFIAVEAVPA